MSGSNFNEVFKVVELHVHWGENDYQGSEHLLEGIKYPLEVSRLVAALSTRFLVLEALFV
jgi:hypothetical protein